MAKELTPQRIEGLCGVGVMRVVCGRYHSLVLDKRGNVWAFGDNSRGQCGISTAMIVAAPEKIGGWVGGLREERRKEEEERGRGASLSWWFVVVVVLVADYPDGGGGGGGGGGGTTLNVGGVGGAKVCQISCGYYFSVLLTTEGQIVTFGENSRGQLGRVTDEEVERVPGVVESMRGVRVVQVCCGKDHTLALTSDTDLFGFGANDYGQLGLPRGYSDQGEWDDH